MRALQHHRLPFRSPSGAVLAYLVLTPVRDAASAASAPLAEADEADAREHGETAVQLREAERYEYEIEPVTSADLRLRCSVGSRRRNLKAGAPDAGVIETGSFCGTLVMELVQGDANVGSAAVASALLDVRSVKLDYRTEYRGMLRRLSDELAGLVSDARSSAKAGFRSSFEARTDEGWIQIQLELLRETVDSAEFGAALQRVLSFPHERLSVASDCVPTDRWVRWTPSAIRQLVGPIPKHEIPPDHPLRFALGTSTIAGHVTVPRKSRDLDTPENRFVKFALSEFRAFLTHAEGVFGSCAGWHASAALARRLASAIDGWLARGLFREVGDMRFAPLGSPVLQRRAGYRELLRWWLRFRTAAELSWEGGEDLFRAGQRNVASLYEYWLFFELLGWFCRKCRGGSRPAIEQLVEGLDKGLPNLRLRKQAELGPFEGSFSEDGRRLKARFSYNRRFDVAKDSHQAGSWTRRLHPDYTLSFWPDDLTEAEAERRELLVHVHFDAKYRVEDVEAIFGAEEEDDADDETQGNFKRQDLMKMHAYRDAIRRSQGAYVLYPGGQRAPVTFRGYHEILPGLGAFSIAPDENGLARGLDSLEKFLGALLSHLSNRTTALERVSYHVAEAYSLREEPVTYGALRLPETDYLAPDYRALPPAEHMVLVSWYRSEVQARLAASDNGFAFVRLGRRSGALHVHPNLSRARHLLLRTDGGIVAPGLLRLREPGFRVYTRSQLRIELRKHAGSSGVAAWVASAGTDDDEHIYALFQTGPDRAYRDLVWSGSALMDLIETFESDARNRPVGNLGRTSPFPRVIPLRDLLKARATA